VIKVLLGTFATAVFIEMHCKYDGTPYSPDSGCSFTYNSCAYVELEAFVACSITHRTKNPLSFRQNLKTATENK
jgi:hypothetical protein